MPACREGERTEFYFMCLRCSIFQDRGRCFRGISTIGSGAFGGYMPAGQKGMRTKLFFRTSAVEVPRSGGARGGKFQWIATLGGGAFGICMLAGREGERGKLCFCTSALQFFWTGGRCFPADLYNRRRRFWYMHPSVSGGRADRTVLFLRRSIFTERGLRFPADLYNRRRRFWYVMYASGSGGRAG